MQNRSKAPNLQNKLVLEKAWQEARQLGGLTAGFAISLALSILIFANLQDQTNEVAVILLITSLAFFTFTVIAGCFAVPSYKKWRRMKRRADEAQAYYYGKP